MAQTPGTATGPWPDSIARTEAAPRPHFSMDEHFIPRLLETSNITRSFTDACTAPEAGVKAG